jgi:hypothetical protein
MKAFKFSTAETTGTIRLLATEVSSEFRNGLTVWTYNLPYHCLNPSPTYIWSTSSICWWCLFIGLIGVWGTAYDFFGIEGRYLPYWSHPIFMTFAIALLWIAFRHRREHWVSFTGREGAHLRYAQNGPEAARFSEFTSDLIQRIKSASDSESPSQSA